MTIGRRGFLMAGSAVAGVGLLPAAQVLAAPVAGGRNVTEFGVEPSEDADQTEALQKAIDELAHAGSPIIFPAGVFNASKLSLRTRSATIIGAPGLTQLKVNEFDVTVSSELRGSFALSGMMFEGRVNAAAPHLTIRNAFVSIANCVFLGGENDGPAIRLANCLGGLQGVAVIWYAGTGIAAFESPVYIGGCELAGCRTGIEASASAGIRLAQNKIDKCDIGIAVKGDAVIAGNIVNGAKTFGLKLGGDPGHGSILAQGNALTDCRVGIGVTSAGDDILASLNMIKGARDGAIRAFHGKDLVGPDLAMESSESYLNLMVVGNVAR
jgi:hypothetical protein